VLCSVQFVKPSGDICFT